jgi:hypothetical protein
MDKVRNKESICLDTVPVFDITVLSGQRRGGLTRQHSCLLHIYDCIAERSPHSVWRWLTHCLFRRRVCIFSGEISKWFVRCIHAAQSPCSLHVSASAIWLIQQCNRYADVKGLMNEACDYSLCLKTHRCGCRIDRLPSTTRQLCWRYVVYVDVSWLFLL